MNRIIEASLGLVLVAELALIIVFRNHLDIPAYNLPVTTNTYLSLGEAVSALALIFAVRQLADKSWRITLSIKGPIKRSMVSVAAAIGIATTLISVMISPPEVGSSPSLVNNPLFWQIVAFVSFATAPFTLWRVGKNRRALFTKTSAKRFYHTLLQEISTGNDEKIKVSVDIILENLDLLMAAIASYSKDIHKKRDGHQLYALILLETALSDKKVATYIATQRIDFLWNYVACIKKYSLRSRDLGDSFEAIISQLYIDPESYLYRQERHRGTGRYVSINQAIFASDFVAREFGPLRKWSIYDAPKEIIFTEKFCEIFLRSFTTTISSASAFNDAGIGHYVAFMLHELNNYARDVIWEDPSPTTYDTHHKIISKINTFYSTTFPDAYISAMKKGKVSSYESEVHVDLRAGRRFKQGLAVTYAERYVEFIGLLSFYSKESLSIHNTLIFTVDNLFEREELANIRHAFFKFAWEAIRHTVESGLYPSFIAIYIQIMYFHGNTENAEVKAERKKLISYLHRVLKPKLKENRMMNNGQHPMEEAIASAHFRYDRSTNHFIWINNFGEESRFK